MSRGRFLLQHLVLASLLAPLVGSVPAAQTPAPSGPAAPPRRIAARSAPPLQLSVDRIMRGPDLVGYPPTGLRWADDSKRLYFERRLPGDDEYSTCMRRPPSS